MAGKTIAVIIVTFNGQDYIASCLDSLLKQTNKNFITYITELRIARAQELLTNTTLPIIDIAAEVGYERQSYFTKKFKELSGITPRQFRASSSLLSKR